MIDPEVQAQLDSLRDLIHSVDNDVQVLGIDVAELKQERSSINQKLMSLPNISLPFGCHRCQLCGAEDTEKGLRSPAAHNGDCPVADAQCDELTSALKAAGKAVPAYGSSEWQEAYKSMGGS